MSGPGRILTSLRNAPARAMTKEEIREECRRAWIERGIVVILDPSLIANDFAKQAVINTATQLYGRRMKKR